MDPSGVIGILLRHQTIGMMEDHYMIFENPHYMLVIISLTPNLRSVKKSFDLII